MRLHLISLPHTETTKDYSWCAFTSLVRSMATMMTREGHEVILYAGPHNDAECSEHVVCSKQPATCDPFVPPWTEEYFRPMNTKVIKEIKKRIKPGDIILRTEGPCTDPIAAVFPKNINCEPICGYAGATAPCKVYPSEAWRHLVSGWQCGLRQENVHTIWGMSSDATIPHFLDVKDFPKGKGGDYLLFIGRLNSMKGEDVAVETSKRTGILLKIVGSGTPPKYGEYIGVVGPKERAKLMGNALAVITPSQFPEPFGLVAIEAQMCGTPSITTDWGAFTSTVEDGVSGYRCNTIDEFCEAALKAKDLNRDKIRGRAIRLYSLEAVGPQYTRYFERLQEIMSL